MLKNKKCSVFLLTTINITLVIVICSLIIFFIAVKDQWNAKANVITLAQEDYQLRDIRKVDFYNGTHSTMTVFGKDKQNQPILITYNEQFKEISHYYTHQGISSFKASQLANQENGEKIAKITFGNEFKRPIWEVKSKDHFYYIDFVTGKILNKENV